MTIVELEKRIRILEKELEDARSAIRRNAEQVTQALGALQSLREETSSELKKIISGVNDVVQKLKNPVSISRI